jgi:hypothetical protein
MDFLFALNNRKSLALAGGPAQREAACFAALRVFHLNDFSTEPSERLGAARAGLELGQVENTDAGAEGQAASHSQLPQNYSGSRYK